MIQRPTEIDNLIGIGSLNEADPNPENVERFLERAERLLKDAENTSISDDAAFIAAYEAILAVCHAALLHHGARPANGAGHRVAALQVGLQTIGLASKVQIISQLHNQRNRATYEDPDQPLAPGTVKLTVEVLREALQACRALIAMNP